MVSTSGSDEKFLSSCRIHIIDRNIIRARMGIFETQIERFGGVIIRKPSPDQSITHILIDDDLSDAAIENILSKLPSVLFGTDTEILRTKWLSGCIKQKKLLDPTPYRVKLPKEIENNNSKNVLSQNRKRPALLEEEGNRSVYDKTTDDEEDDDLSDATSTPSPSSKKPHFACENPSAASAGALVNHNKHITDKLQVLAEGYKSTNDKWRALSYEKAIQVLSQYPKRISNFEELTKLRGIGQRLAEKIWEIHESGELRKADEFSKDEKVRTMNIFTNIFGVGPTIAHQWFVQGLRTLKDVEEKVNLTYQQKIGIRYFDQFQMRMERAEAEEIVSTVINATKKLNPDLVIQAGGSYRRGCATCGDVDFIITHPDGSSHEKALGPLVNNLREDGFLTDDLVECDIEGSHRKYMGVCKLKGEDKKHRRIDIIAVPYEEYATALIYFTGSVYFVRSIYGKAKHMGMRLNQHGLRGGVMRQGGETLNDGYLIPTPTEESVFEQLGIPYRTPQERNLSSNNL